MRERFIPKMPVVDRDPYIASLARGKSVLHIGMGGFVDHADMTSKDFLDHDLKETLHYRLSEVAARVDGVDINPTVLDYMKKAIPGDYYLADVTGDRFCADLHDKKYQVVVFADVIEHLDDFRSAIRNLKSVLVDDGILVISTANAYSIDGFLKLMFRYEAVHEEHTSYFSYRTIRRLLEMNKLRLVDFTYYTHQGRKHFDGLTHRIGYLLEKPVVKMFPQYAMGLVAVTQKAD